MEIQHLTNYTVALLQFHGALEAGSQHTHRQEFRASLQEAEEPLCIPDALPALIRLLNGGKELPQTLAEAAGGHGRWLNQGLLQPGQVQLQRK